MRGASYMIACNRLSSVLWGSEATLHKQWRKLKAQESEPKLRHKQKKTKRSFSTVNFSKVDPLYKYRSVSFYREASGLFTYWNYPRVKRIETECTRLILGSLQLGLHIIGAPWRHAANHGALLVISTCACREKTLSLLENPLSPGAFFHLKHMPKPNLSALDVRGDETPWAKPKPWLAGWVRFRLWGFVAKKNSPSDCDPETLNLWTYSTVLLETKGIGRKMGSEKWKRT
jgi:hypothetical protein